MCDVISVKTNQTVKTREGVCLYFVQMNRLPNFLQCQDFKQVPSLVNHASKSDRVTLRFTCFYVLSFGTLLYAL